MKRDIATTPLDCPLHNTYVAVLRNYKTGETGAMRMQVMDSTTNEPREVRNHEDAETRKWLRETTRDYIKAMKWIGKPQKHQVLIFGPMTALASHVLYDSIPGDRSTPRQVADMVKSATARGTPAVNMRRLEDVN